MPVLVRLSSFAVAPNRCLSSFARLSLPVLVRPSSLPVLFASAPNRCLSSFGSSRSLPVLVRLSSFVLPVLIRSHSSCLSSFALIRSHSLLIVACPRSLFWSSFARSSLSSFVLRSLSLPVLVRLALIRFIRSHSLLIVACPRSSSSLGPRSSRSSSLYLSSFALTIVACPRSLSHDRCLSSFVLA